VAVVLAVAATGLKPLQDMNEAQAKRKAILQSVMEVNDATLEADYNQYINEVVVDAEGNELAGVKAFDLDVRKERKKDASERHLPIFVYENGARKNYIIPMEGNGLWGPIRGYLALEEDLNTISGVVFDHDKETPGLGGEIIADYFQEQFQGKKLFDDQGTFQSIRVLKGRSNEIEGKPHQVDGMTGATMTSNGVTNMFRDELENYTTYFEKLKG
jgi:Na+-transporting NADH:ubiquinone oxidoreductase subunit C